MATGLSIPVRTNIAGGSQKVTSSEQTKKMLFLALSEGDDNNPFQDIGLRPSVIYQQPGPIANAEIRLEVERILKKFENKIVVSPTKPITVKQDGNVLLVEFDYIDLEINQVQEFNKALTRPNV